jgi:hypothetical protein
MLSTAVAVDGLPSPNKGRIPEKITQIRAPAPALALVGAVDADDDLSKIAMRVQGISLLPTTFNKMPSAKASTASRVKVEIITAAPSGSSEISKVAQIKAKARQRWKTNGGRGMVQIFYHITHSAGTTLCNLAQDPLNHFKNVPSFACIGTPLLTAREWIEKETMFYAIETSLPLQNYGMGMKYKQPKVDLPHGLPLTEDTLLITCLRDPILRLMSDLALPGHTHASAGNYKLDLHKTDPKHKPGDVWEYNVRWLGGGTDEAALKLSIERLEIFQVVLIVEWIDTSTRLLCADLGWTNCNVATRTVGSEGNHIGEHRKAPNPRLVMQNDEVYFRLVYQNQLSIRLYEHAKMICLQQLEKAKLPMPATAHNMYDYTADIIEANRRYVEHPWVRYCFYGNSMRPCKDQRTFERAHSPHYMRSDGTVIHRYHTPKR